VSSRSQGGFQAPFRRAASWYGIGKPGEDEIGVREFLRIYWPLIAITVLGVIVALMFVAPAPPKHVVVAGGAQGGAYAAAAEEYAVSLREKGVKATVINTAGSVDNLGRLNAGEAAIAVVQAGTAGDLDTDDLRSLGAIFYEPLWVFHRKGIQMSDLRDVEGKRVAVGAEGSGLRALTDLLLPEAGVEPGEYTPVELGGQAAANALQAGDVDIALIVSGADPAWIVGLVADPDIELLSLDRVRALKRRHPFLDEVILYAGVLDPARNLPAEDITLLAPAAEIVVRKVDGHPLGIGNLAGDLHGEVGVIPPGPELIRHLVQDLGDLGRVVLADSEGNGLAELT